jgi:hypothetical protein
MRIGFPFGALTLCAALCGACGPVDAAGEGQPEPAGSSAASPLEVSMIQLIARAADFDGEYVRVFGFYNHEFEGTALYLHREDFEQHLSRNAIWMAGRAADDERYILVEGRFNARSRGHMGLFSGEIVDITRTVAWPPPGARRARESEAR